MIRSGLFVVGMMPCFCVAWSYMMLRGGTGQRPTVPVGECSSCPRNYRGKMTLASRRSEKIDCEKTYEEAEARRVQYKADAKV